MGHPYTNTPLNDLQSTYRKFKAKAGNKIRKFLGEPEPTIRDFKDYDPAVKILKDDGMVGYTPQPPGQTAGHLSGAAAKNYIKGTK